MGVFALADAVRKRKNTHKKKIKVRETRFAHLRKG